MMTIPEPPAPPVPGTPAPPPPTNEAAVIIPVNTKLLDIPALLIVVSLSKVIYFSLTSGEVFSIYEE